MGKTVKAIVGFVVAIGLIVAGVITMNPQLIITGLSIGIATLQSVMAKGPKTSPSASSRLMADIDPRTPRKGAFGSTALNTDIRDQEYTGTDKEYLHRFIVVASHAVTAIREIWFDDKLAWTAAGGVQGEYVGYLTVATRLEGTPANAINISARMGDSRRYTGCAYVHFRYKLTGNSKKTESPFSSSVPSRMTIVGDGMPVYDARYDSTVPGGAGPARADDQTTWQFSYSGSNSGRNPACQMATYLLGWHIKNPVTNAWKLAVGKGVPPDRLDLPSFITAANLCEEAVALAAGGTELRYRSDGVFSEFDQATDVLDNLKAAMSADLDDMDGLIRVTVLHNDLAVPVLHIVADDVLGDYNWEPFPSLETSRNVVRGSYVDPSTKSLYQMIPYPDVETDSPDGIERAEPVTYQFVQSASQAQRLSKQRLQRAQFAGTFSAEFKSRLWRVQKGDVVSFTFSPARFEAKLFRVVETAVQVDGRVPVILREEHPLIYQWDSDEKPAVQAVDASSYTNFDLPLSQFLDTIETGANVTGEHVAADFAGRGALATLNAVDLATSQVVNKSLANVDAAADTKLGTVATGATVGARAGTNIYRTDGTTVLNQAQIVTAEGTAADFAGRGALATLNAVDLATAQVANKSLANVDATANTKLGGIAAGATVGARSGTNIYRTDGTTILAQSEIRTAEGTAADFVGRGAFATLNTASLDTYITDGTTYKRYATTEQTKLAGVATGATVGARAGTNIYRTDGTTVLTQAEVRTAEGTAADFVGRGTLATLNTVTYGTGTVAGFGTLAARNNARLANEVYRADGTTIATEAMLVTAQGTAADFTGRGALATLNAVDLATSQVANKSLANVDATANTKLGGIAAGATVGARSGTNLYRTDGTTVLTQAEVRTLEGTAADFTGRGALATLNAVDLATAQVANKSLANVDATANTKLGGIAAGATVGARSGTNLYRTDGTTVLTQAEVRTLEGTAADFTGRGALATLNSADFATQVVGAGKPTLNAGTTVTPYAIGVGTVEIQGNRTKLLTTNEWTASVLLREVVNRSGFIRARNSGGYYIFVGLTLDTSPMAGAFAPAKNTFCMQCNPAIGSATIYAQGAGIYDAYPAVAPTMNSVMQVECRGQRIFFFLDKVELASAPAPAGMGALTPRVDFWYAGAEASDIAAGPSADTFTYRDDGYTKMAQAETRTAEGTAADFTGRGALATLNAVDLATSQVANKSLANVDATANTKLAGVAAGATVGSRAGTNLYRTDGTTVLTQAEVRTAEGTAADFTGRGALATLNTVALGTQVTGRVPDSRSLNTSNSFGLRSLADHPAFTDTDNTGSVTINIPSVVLYGDWGGSVTLPTGSVPGCAYNTLYIVYRVQPDPTTTGTSYGVTTDISQALGAGKAYLGAYRTRAAAGAPPPPPPPAPGDADYNECVSAAALVETRDRGDVRADEIVPGDMLRVLTADREGTEWAAVTKNYTTTARRRRITSASGVSLTVSAGCPFTLRDGSLAWACEVAAVTLPVLVAGEPLRWEPCVLEEIEAGPVAHIHIHQRTYAAGDLAGRSILTHNPLSYPVKP